MVEKQIQFRPGSELRKQLTERAGETFVPSPALVAQRDLERYYQLLGFARPTFSQGEAMLLVDAMNGCMLDMHTVHLLWANIADAIDSDGLDTKWEVDGTSLVQRLRSLSRIECLAVYDAIERAWNTETYRIENMEERVKRVGLVRGEGQQS